MLKKIGAMRFSDWVLLFAVFCIGGFHEFISCALSVLMCIYLLLRLFRQRQLRICHSLLSASVGLICLGYGLTVLWGIDAGMAFMGFLKFLPLGLYLLCLWQEEKEGCILRLLPYMGAVMAVISAVGMEIPSLRSWFSVADRLAGFFQYPNTFALFLLVCELLLLKKEGKRLWDYGVILLLVAALLYTGSRTVFVVFALSNVAMLFALSKKRVRTVLLILGSAVCVAAVILIFAENSVLRRYLTISLTESTFVGRILYVADALPLLLKYPFGMGYMGYFYVQQTIQTGVYSVAYIHNDFFQLLLDVGWAPTLVFLAAIVSWFCKKQVCLGDKIIVASICLHSLLDFDLQFMGMFLLLILLLERGFRAKPVLWKAHIPFKTVFAAMGLVSLYMGVALTLAFGGAYSAADALFPGNTRNKLTMIQQTEDLTQANLLADEILETNTHYYVPYWVKAKYAYSQGDFTQVMQYQNQAITANPFGHQLYEEYCNMLVKGVELYQAAGDVDSARICRSSLIDIQHRLRAQTNRLSTLGKMIDDQPVTELPQELQYIIWQIGG